jgi:hypothetical protein
LLAEFIKICGKSLIDSVDTERSPLVAAVWLQKSRIGVRQIDVLIFAYLYHPNVVDQRLKHPSIEYIKIIRAQVDLLQLEQIGKYTQMKRRYLIVIFGNFNKIYKITAPSL